MTSKHSVFLLFLSIVLGISLFGSIAFSYFFGNFGGVSIKEIKNEYIPKTQIKFSDLPLDLQKKYISKEIIAPKPKNDLGLEKVFDEDGNPIINVQGDVNELQSMIKSLQDKVLFLEQENLFISNERDELLQNIQNEKSSRKVEETTLLSQNLENINEAEKQHYQNISDLTMKINDLQRENLQLADTLNKQKNTQKEQKQQLQTQLQEAREKSQLLLEELTKTATQKEFALQSENEKLQISLQKMTQKQKQLQQDKQDIEERFDKIAREKNTLLQQSKQQIAKLEEKYNTQVNQTDYIALEAKEQKQQLIKEYEAKINQKSFEYMKLINAQKESNKKLQEELNKVSSTSIEILNNGEKALQKKEEEYKALLAKIQNQLDEEQQTYKNTALQFQKEIAQVELTKQNLEQKISSLKQEKEQQNDIILQLQDKISSLDTKNRTFDASVQEKVLKNDKKHNENYKFFNEKIAFMQTKLENNIQIVTDAKKELLEAKQQKDIVVLELKNVKATLVELKTHNEDLQKNENQKLKEIKKSFEALQKETQKREDDYIAMITNLKDTLKKKDAVIVSLQDAKEATKNKKLTLISQIQCDDMPAGNFEIGATCKQNVTKFLEQFDSKNFFEIIPIVGTGGFGTLNRLRNNVSMNVPEAEINRLTELSNLGLGKFRAASGGALVREKFGEYAKISYPIDAIEKQGKRGFLIKVYE
ncbi:MAG: hypothetical protein IBX44_06780 [Sulfurospirillum sp.]|nr:hypothetical protein [Sulfurospirillum sp.]